MGKLYLQTEVEEATNENQEHMDNRERLEALSNPSKNLKLANKNRVSGTPKQVHR